jgi:hypothetical protein
MQGNIRRIVKASGGRLGVVLTTVINKEDRSPHPAQLAHGSFTNQGGRFLARGYSGPRRWAADAHCPLVSCHKRPMEVGVWKRSKGEWGVWRRTGASLEGRIRALPREEKNDLEQDTGSRDTFSISKTAHCNSKEKDIERR